VGVAGELREVADRAHAIGTALAVVRASGFGIHARPAALDALWAEARRYRAEGRLAEYAAMLVRIAARLVQQGETHRAESCLTVAASLARRLDLTAVSVPLAANGPISEA
jgi:hypothetical protein